MSSDSRVLLNFLWQGAGGGVQNALGFIETLARTDDPSRFHVFARSGSAIAEKARDLGFACDVVDSRAMSLHRFSLTCGRMFSPGQVCFTFFGPPWLGTVGRLTNVCGVAYSNLYYPEVDFWKPHRGPSLWRRIVTDRFRLWQLSKADYWIFETDALARRATTLAGYPSDRVGVVRMTASPLVRPQRVQEVAAREFDERIPRGFRFLFLAAAAPNKRIDRAAAIAAHLARKLKQPFTIVTTMAHDAPYCRQVADAFRRHGVSDRWFNVGPCPHDRVASLISACDAMCLFSVLESFSNNMVEAWAMGKPLVAADGDWAQSSGGSGAMYVDPERPQEAAAAMAAIVQDVMLRDQLIREGSMALATYPTAEEKCRLYLRAIESARRLGPMAGDQRCHVAKWRVTEPQAVGRPTCAAL